MIKRTLKKINKTFYPGRLFFEPEYIILGVNNVCNLHCKMCDVGTQNNETNFAQNLVGSKPINMPLELFKMIVDQVAASFPMAKIGYAFTEPLIYPSLKDSLAYAHQNGLETSVTTNALLLKRKAEDLITGRVKDLYISLDGLEDTHNFIRGNKRSFQSAIEGIEHIMSFENAPDVSVFCVITEWNYSDLEKFAEFFTNFPIKQLGFLHQNFITKAMADTHNMDYGHICKATFSNVELTDFSKIDLKVLHREIQNVKAGGYNFNLSFSPEINDIDTLTLYYHKPEIKIGKTCNDLFTNIMIKTDGTVIPSHGRCYNMPLGNIYRTPLETIWNSKPYANFRKELVNAGGQFPACYRCCSAF